jgi:hypothetical protein
VVPARLFLRIAPAVLIRAQVVGRLVSTVSKVRTLPILEVLAARRALLGCLHREEHHLATALVLVARAIAVAAAMEGAAAAVAAVVAVAEAAAEAAAVVAFRVTRLLQ